MSETTPTDPQDPTKQTPPEGGTQENLPPKKEGEEGENDQSQKGSDPTPPTPEVPTPPAETPPAPPTPPAPETPPVDYKGKFSESTRRNQIVEGQKAELERALADITKQEVPTDEEMKEIDPDWEYRSPFEKNQALRLEVLTRKEAKRDLEARARQVAEENQRKLEEYIFSEPKLKGKEESFAAFATSKKNAGAPMEILLNAFLFEVKDETPPENPTPPVPETPPQLNRSTPSGGNPPEPKDKELTPEEIQVIRTTDHKRYNELVRTGKI